MKNLLKNRIVVGLICIITALVICFGLTPMFNDALKSKVELVRVTTEIKKGDEITAKMLTTVEVGGYNLPSNVVYKAEDVVSVICKQVEAVLLDGRNPSEFTLTNHERLLRLTAAIKKQQDILTKLKTARKNVFEEYYSEHITKERYSARLAANSEQSTTETDKLQALQNEYASITENSRETEYQPTHRKYGFADKLTREMVMELVKEIRVFGDDRFEIVWNYEDYYRLSGVIT